MHQQIKLDKNETRNLKEIEDSISEDPEFSAFRLADYPVCKAIVATRPTPRQAFARQLAGRMIPAAQVRLRKIKRPAAPQLLTPVNISVIGILIAFLFVFGTPQGRGLAQGILTFFERESENEVPESSVIQPTRSVETAALEDAADLLNFQLVYPTFLPEGYIFGNLEIDPGGEFGILTFNGPTAANGVMNPQLTLRQQTSPFLELIGPDAEVVSVQVGPNPAEYVEGGWVYISENSTEASDEEKTFHWERTFVPLQRLRWMIGDVFIELGFVGSDTQEGFLDISDLIAIAEGLE